MSDVSTDRSGRAVGVATDTTRRIEEIRAALAGIPDDWDGGLPSGSCAVLATLVPTQEGLCFLFERRPEGPSRFAGHLSFPGGRIEPEDASPLDAALRESFEEIGFQPNQVDILGHLADTTDPIGRHVTCFVGVVRLEDVPAEAASPEEVDEIILVPCGDLERPLDPIPGGDWPRHVYRTDGYEARMHPSRERIVQYWPLRAVHEEKTATLWGFTGGLVAQFLDQVHGWAPPLPPRIVQHWEEMLP